MDGTSIAYERFGDGPPVVLVGSALCDRSATRPLAEALAGRFTVINYDRRGRGGSGDAARYAVEREIEDLGALIAQVGGAASVYGHSSGAALALHAAAYGLPISALVLHEPPFALDEDPEREKRERREVEALEALLAEGRRREAVAAFLVPTGLPQEVIDGAIADPGTLACAHTLPHDPYQVLSRDSRGGRTPTEQAAGVDVPALVVCGGAGLDWMIDTARRIAEAMPNGRHLVLKDQSHVVPPEVLAPALEEFLAAIP